MDRPFALSDVKSLPKHPQTQVSLETQLELARAVCNQLGLYDAADYLRRK